MSAAADAAFLEETFQAVLTLLEDARDHVAAGLAADLSAPQRMVAAQELSRLTNRATAAMSLLLLAKALGEGQDVGQGASPEALAVQAAGILADIDRAPAAPIAGTDAAVAPPPALAALVARGDALLARMPRIHDHVRGLLGQA